MRIKQKQQARKIKMKIKPISRIQKAKMKINFLMISYQLNFFGEKCIEAIGNDLPSNFYIIHNGKEREYADKFKYNHKAKKLFYVFQDRVHHVRILEDVFIENKYPEICNCDYVVVIDHDIMFEKNNWNKYFTMLHNNMDYKTLIIGPQSHRINKRSYIKFYLTHLMAIKANWDIFRKKHPDLSFYWEYPLYDTGQYIDLYSNKNNLDLVKRLEFPNWKDNFHYGSDWSSEVRKHPADKKAYKFVMEVFRPNKEDRKIMVQFPYFQMMFEDFER